MIAVPANNLYSRGGFTLITEKGELLKRNKLTRVGAYKDTDRTHALREGDTLDNLAYLYYGDSKLWFILADINKIMNPFELTVGETILIPNPDTLTL